MTGALEEFLRKKHKAYAEQLWFRFTQSLINKETNIFAACNEYVAKELVNHLKIDPIQLISGCTENQGSCIHTATIKPKELSMNREQIIEQIQSTQADIRHYHVRIKELEKEVARLNNELNKYNIRIGDEVTLLDHSSMQVFTDNGLIDHHSFVPIVGIVKALGCSFPTRNNYLDIKIINDTIVESIGNLLATQRKYLKKM